MGKRVSLIAIIFLLICLTACGNRIPGANGAMADASTYELPPTATQHDEDNTKSILLEEDGVNKGALLGAGDGITKLYGDFEIKEYYPTVEWLKGIDYDMPNEDIDKLMNTIVTIAQEEYVGYDNYRFPEKFFYRDSFVDSFAILSPSYAIEVIPYDKLSAIAPTREEAVEYYCGVREEYILVSVNPGFTNPEADSKYISIPQFVIVDSDSILLFLNGVSFLAKRVP